MSSRTAAILHLCCLAGGITCSILNSEKHIQQEAARDDSGAQGRDLHTQGWLLQNLVFTRARIWGIGDQSPTGGRHATLQEVSHWGTAARYGSPAKTTCNSRLRTSAADAGPQASGGGSRHDLGQPDSGDRGREVEPVSTTTRRDPPTVAVGKIGERASQVEEERLTACLKTSDL